VHGRRRKLREISWPRRVPGQRGRGADSQRQFRVSTGTHPSL